MRVGGCLGVGVGIYDPPPYKLQGVQETPCDVEHYPDPLTHTHTHTHTHTRTRRNTEERQKTGNPGAARTHSDTLINTHTHYQIHL